MKIYLCKHTIPSEILEKYPCVNTDYKSYSSKNDTTLEDIIIYECRSSASQKSKTGYLLCDIEEADLILLTLSDVFIAEVGEFSMDRPSYLLLLVRQHLQQRSLIE